MATQTSPARFGRDLQQTIPHKQHVSPFCKCIQVPEKDPNKSPRIVYLFSQPVSATVINRSAYAEDSLHIGSIGIVNVAIPILSTIAKLNSMCISRSGPVPFINYIHIITTRVLYILRAAIKATPVQLN